MLVIFEQLVKTFVPKVVTLFNTMSPDNLDDRNALLPILLAYCISEAVNVKEEQPSKQLSPKEVTLFIFSIEDNMLQYSNALLCIVLQESGRITLVRLEHLLKALTGIDDTEPKFLTVSNPEQYVNWSVPVKLTRFGIFTSFKPDSAY